MESAVTIKVLGFDFDGTLARILKGKTTSDAIEKKLEPYDFADDDAPPEVEKENIEQVIDEHGSILVEGILKEKLLEAIQNDYQIAIISSSIYPYAATYFLKKIIGLDDESIAKIHLEFKCPLTTEGKVIGMERVLTKICKAKELQTVNIQAAYFEDEEEKAKALKRAFGQGIVTSIATADGKHIDELNNIQTTFANIIPFQFTVGQASLALQPETKRRAKSRLTHAYSISTVSHPDFGDGDIHTRKAKKGLSRSFSMFDEISPAGAMASSKHEQSDAHTSKVTKGLSRSSSMFNETPPAQPEASSKYEKGDARTSKFTKALSRSSSMLNETSPASPMVGSKRELEAKKTPSPKRLCTTSPDSPGLSEPFSNLKFYRPANFFAILNPPPAVTDTCRSPRQFDAPTENYVAPLTP